MVTMQDLLVECENCKWSFVTHYNGKHTLSPRRFATMGDALRAICEKLAMHALDAEFPTIGLVCLENSDVERRSDRGTEEDNR